MWSWRWKISGWRWNATSRMWWNIWCRITLSSRMSSINRASSGRRSSPSRWDATTSSTSLAWSMCSRHVRRYVSIVLTDWHYTCYILRDIRDMRLEIWSIYYSHDIKIWYQRYDIRDMVSEYDIRDMISEYDIRDMISEIWYAWWYNKYRIFQYMDGI